MDKNSVGKEKKKQTGYGCTVLACLIAAVLIICVQIAGAYFNLESFLRRETAYPGIEIGIRGAIEQLTYKIDTESEKDQRDALTDTYFRAVSLRDKVNDKDFLENSSDEYGKAFAVKVEGDKVIFPEDVESAPEITAAVLKGEQGIIDTSSGSDWRSFAAFSRISNGYYAVKVVYASEGSDNLATIALDEIETAFDGKALLLDENGRFIYCNSDLEIPDLRNENGLDENTFNAFLEKHAPYYVTARSADEKYTLVLFLSRSAIISDYISVDLLVTLVEAVIAIILIVWLTEIRKLLKRGAAGPDKAKQYQPSIIKGKVRTFCILAIAAVLLTGMFSSAVGSLYSVTWDAQNTLSAVERMNEENRFITDNRSDELKEKDFKHAEIIADTLYRDPRARTQKQLRTFKDALSANYIMLYDRDGREILTDSSYINMNIGGLSSSDMHAFRRVLNGGAKAYLENVTDNVTGAKSDIVGVRMPSITEDNDGGYNLLVISFPPAAERGVALYRDSDELISSLVSSYNRFMLLDKNRKITFMTNKDLYGRDPLELGMQEDEIRDNFLGEFKLDNDVYYGASSEIDGELFYYLAKSSVLHEGMFAFGILEAIGFLIVLLVTIRLLMKDYDRIYEGCAAEENRNRDNNVSAGAGWFSGLPWIKKAVTPEAKAKAVFNILGGLCILLIGILAITSGGAGEKDSLIPFIFSDNWDKGFNLFAFARIIFMICGAAVIWSIISFIICVAIDLLDTRGVTVARLVKNVLSYVVVLVVIYYSALYLGFDPATLLASIGIIGLAISLGVKDVIADVFSGVSLIFEKAFQVGDIVELDGVVRGTVQELGVRTIKLFGDDNNLKVVRYSDIHKVNNLSRSNSWCVAEFTVKNNVDTEELKKLLRAELPEIRARHSEILSDPVFTGISSINTGSITFGIRAECKESKMRKVRSSLNYEIRDLLIRNGIDML